MATSTKQLPRRKRIRHQVFAKLRHTDAGRFQKFIGEQAERLGAARRGIRDLLLLLGSKSIADVDNASTAASLGASRITGSTSLKFTALEHANPGAITVGAVISGQALIFSPRLVSGVALVLSGDRITRGTGAWDQTTYPAGTKVRLRIGGTVSGVYEVASYPSTSGLDLVSGGFGGSPVNIDAASGILEAHRTISGTDFATAGLQASGVVLRPIGGVTTNSGDHTTSGLLAVSGIVDVNADLTYESAPSGQLFAANVIACQNASFALSDGDLGVYLPRVMLLATGINTLSGGYIHTVGDGTGTAETDAYVLSGACFSGYEVLASGTARLIGSSVVSGGNWATSGFAVGDQFSVSGVSAALDAGSPYTVRKLMPSGVQTDLMAFALGTDVTDNAHTVFEVASGSR